MKSDMIWLSGLLMLSITGCQQEKDQELDKALDLNISFEDENSMPDLPEYLSVSLVNDSESPVKLPDGLWVLEFTSYSGSVQRMVPLSEDYIKSDPEWSQYKDYTLQPGEKLDLRIGLRDILLDTPGRLAIGLPADDYTVNAFLTPETQVENLPVATKIRSNYLDLAIDYNHEKMSMNGET